MDQPQQTPPDIDQATLDQLQAEMQNPNPQAPPTPPDAGPSDADRMLSAQQEGNKQQMYANLLRSFQGAIQSAAPSSGFKADPTVANSIEASAKEPVQQAQQSIAQEATRRKEDMEKQKLGMEKEKHGQEMQKGDAFLEAAKTKLAEDKITLADTQRGDEMDSPITQSTRQLAHLYAQMSGGKFDDKQIDSMTGNQILKLMPEIQKAGFEYLKDAQHHETLASQQKIEDKKANVQMETNKLTNQTRQDVADTKAESVKAAAAAKEAAKKAETDNKDAKEIQGYIDKGWTARSGTAGTVQNKIVAAEAAEKLIDQGRNQPNGLTKSQIEELSQNVGLLVGGGKSQASARIQALVPHTMLGQAQDWKAYLSGLPQGAKQQEFVEMMAETIKREKELANDQKRQFIIEGTSTSRLRKENPDMYNAKLGAAGITPDMIDEKGRYKKPGSGDTVKMLDPQGNIRDIPKDQVEAAKAKGGTVAE